MSASTIPMTGTIQPPSSPWQVRTLLRTGLLGGVIAVYLCLVGIVPVFHDRPLIVGVVELGQAALLIAFGAVGYLAARDQVRASRLRAVVAGAAVGAITGAFPAGLVLVSSAVDLRAVFLNASPELYALLTNGQGMSWAWFPIVAGAITGGLAGVLAGLPAALRSPLLLGLGSLVFFGLFAGLLRTPLLVTPLADLARLLLAADGLTVPGAITVFLGTIAILAIARKTKPRQRVNALPKAQRRLVIGPLAILVLALILLFPLALGGFFAQVIATVALFILLGLGLNITLGLAGLLDLGFVAFFAVGAYTVALLTSTAEFGLADLSF